MNKRILIVILALMTWAPARSQDSVNVHAKTFWGAIELGRSLELSVRGGGYVDNKIRSSQSLRAKLGYYLMPRLSLGVGIGFSRYSFINTMPLVLDVRYHFLPSLPDIFACLEVGRSLTPNSTYTSGSVGNLSVAYRLKAGKRFNLNPSVGYDVFTYRQWYMDYYNPENNVSWRTARHAISFRLGLEF